MATISIYAGKTNQMPQMIKSAKTAVNSLKTELASLKKKSIAVDSSICNLDDVVSSISATVKTQEDKAATLDTVAKKSEEFIEKAVKVDNDAADKVNQNKEDFYDKYSYLKPDCEKSKWEKFCDGCKKVVEWCKDNWKSIVKIVAAVVIIVALGIASVLTGGALAVILAGAFWGALIGGLASGLIGGIMSVINGGSFLEAFADGLLSGAITGAVTGAACAGLGVAGQAFGKVVQCGTKLAKAIQITSRVTAVLSLGMDGFDMLAMGIGLFDPNNPLVKLNQKLHESAIYNVFQAGVNALAIFTGAATTTMKCFVAGTLILTVAGYTAIENIRAGDKVLATDPDTMDMAEKIVLETYIRESTDVVHLTVNGEVITSTLDHPFYVQDAGFVGAGDLYIGDKLLDADGNTLLVEDMKFETLAEPVKVYNFKVDEFHTYHVGETSIFVHNADYPSHMNADGTLKPNTEYTAGEHDYTYRTNSDGYIERAHADKIEFKTHDGRLKHNPNTPGKMKGDHAGHLFADQFGGSPELDNLVSQLGDLNRAGGDYWKMEQDWASVLKQNGTVTDVDIRIKYKPNSSRPDSFIVNYTTQLPGQSPVPGFKRFKNF